MKTILHTFFLLCTLSLTGCFDILEEIWLNKDQSGRYELTVTMGSGPMANMIQRAQQKTNDSLVAIGQAPRPMDTMIYLTNLPDSIQKMMPYPEVLKNFQIQLKMEKGVKFRFQYAFSHLDSLYQFWETLEAIEGAMFLIKISLMNIPSTIMTTRPIPANVKNFFIEPAPLIIETPLTLIPPATPSLRERIMLGQP